MARAKRVVRWLWLWPVAMFALAQIATPAAASHVDRYKVVGDMAVYLGVLPSEIVGGHAPEHPEGTVHGGAARGKKESHVVVALFETKTGRRISDADVYARVAEIAKAGESKKLEPMKIGDSVSYGNYFAMSAKGPYRITVEIRSAGAAKPVRAEFEYKHH